MSLVKTGRSHRERKHLFQRGLRRGFLTIQEIEASLPPGTLTAAERWLLYYSLQAAEIEIRDESGALVSVPPLTEEELELLAKERREAEQAQVREAEEPLAALEPSQPGEP